MATPPLPQETFDPLLPQSSGPSCRFCGGFPATDDVTVRAHRGLVVLMQFRSVEGPMCRTCGTALVRDLSAQTLVEGWWGLLSVFIAPLTLFSNALTYRAIRALPEPVRSPGATPIPVGRPLLRRPQALGFIVPIAALALLVATVVRGAASAPTGPVLPPADGNSAAVGECVVNAGTLDTPYLVATHCLDGTLRVVDRIPGSDQTNCPSNTTEAYTVDDAGRDVVLCLTDYTG